MAGHKQNIFCIQPENKNYFPFQTMFSLENDGHWVQYITKGSDNRYYILKSNYLFIVDSGI
jgi:hypothetical protein